MLPTIDTLVTFLTPREGGRRSLSHLGPQYMPHLVVQPADVRTVPADGSRENYLGIRFRGGPAKLTYLETALCRWELMYYPQVNYEEVQVGATFTLREGGRIVGFGTVQERYSEADEPA